MLNFLRNLRRSSSSKYFKYALGEIVLVVIGILIALSINNWNEDRKAMIVSENTKDELRTEIEDALAITRKMTQFNMNVTDTLKKYLEDKLNPTSEEEKSKIVLKTAAYAPLKLSLPILEREIGSDHLILADAQLKEKMRTVNRSITYLPVVQSFLDMFWNNSMVNYFKDQNVLLSFVSQTKLIDKRIDGLNKLYEKEEFKDLVSMEYIHLHDYTREMTELAEALFELTEALNK